MYYFYCPHCGYQEEVEKLPKKVIPNLRDGWGRAIFHYKCSGCGNLDAGFMRMTAGDMNEKVYLRSVIGLYQNIRGFEKGTED